MKTLRVLYLTYDGLTDPLGKSQILPYLSGLAKPGHRFDIVSCEKPTPFSRPSTHPHFGDTSIRWLPQTYHKSPPLLSTLYDLIRFSFFRVFLRGKPQTKLLFITPDSPEIVRNLTRKHEVGPESIRIYHTTRDQAPLALAVSTVGISPIRSAFSKIASNPTKVGDMESFATMNDTGPVLRTLDPGAYRQAVQLLPRFLNQGAEHYRRTAKVALSLTRGVQSYLDVYTKVTLSCNANRGLYQA